MHWIQCVIWLMWWLTSHAYPYVCLTHNLHYILDTTRVLTSARLPLQQPRRTRVRPTSKIHPKSPPLLQQTKNWRHINQLEYRINKKVQQTDSLQAQWRQVRSLSTECPSTCRYRFPPDNMHSPLLCNHISVGHVRNARSRLNKLLITTRTESSGRSKISCAVWLAHYIQARHTRQWLLYGHL
jgi:hypothetical protein